MKINCDATSLINLVHGNVLDQVLSITGLSFSVGNIVLSECKTVRTQIQDEIDRGRIELLPDDYLDATKYLGLLGTYGLGPGETECLAVAQIGDEVVCSDDGRARKILAGALGPNRVIGCLGLLARACQLGVLTPSDAFSAYEQMRSRGAFLPDVPKEQFLELVKTIK